MAFERFDLTDKTALITGAGGVLGLEHALALLESGANVVLTDLSETALRKTRDQLPREFNSQKILMMLMDVSQPEAVKHVATELKLSGIRIDILVNNAAIDPKMEGDQGTSGMSRLENLLIDNWNHQISVGLTGAFLCSQAFGATMANDGKGGVILNISSDLSVISPDQRLYRDETLDEALQPVKPVTYSVIKTGLLGLTRYLATYWAEKGVRCNALSPGGVFNGQDELFVHRLSSLIPMGRMARRDEYRAAIQFLCSDASAYMNGHNLVIDGGRSIL